MSLNYSNQETSVTVGESVRDEDGIYSRFSSSQCTEGPEADSTSSFKYSSSNPQLQVTSTTG
jgi:hypothetical protein